MSEFSTNLSLNLPADGSLPGVWGQPINDNFSDIDDLFGIGGHNHSGEAGHGPKLDHANLLNIGTNTHEAIDAHIACVDLHQDIQIGVVQTDSQSDAVLNVSDLRFANCTVTSPGSGIVVVTPLGGGGASVEQTAPVVHYDTFSAAAGTPIADQNYVVIKNDATAPEYVSAAGSGVEMVINTAANSSGYCTNLLEGFHPHSMVQRVGIVVDSHVPDASLVSDTWSLYLHLLASDRDVNVTSNFPVEAGLSLRMRVVDGGAGSSVLRLDIICRTVNEPSNVRTYSTPFPLPSGFVHPNDGDYYNELPVEFINGHHEFSLSLSAADPTEFYLNYYYNSGLIFRHLFTTADGLFYNAVYDLIDDLKLTAAPAAPNFGRAGWSTTYAVGTDTTFRSQIDAAMASSIGEQVLPRVVDLPDTVDTSLAVCPNTNSGLWTGTTYPGFFDPDAAGPISGDVWSITGLFDIANGLSEGFGISDGNSNKNIYCDTPSTDSPAPVCLKSQKADNTINLFGANLSPVDFTDFRLVAGDNNIPVNWNLGDYDGGRYSAGEVLPPDFATINVAVDSAGNNGQNAYTLTVEGGARLPEGARVTVEADAKYQETFQASFSQAIGICRNEPEILQTGAYRYDPQDGWTPINDQAPICEDEDFVLIFGGKNLPLGRDFWTSGGVKFGIAASESNWSLSDTTLLNGNQGIRVSTTTLHDVFYDGIYESSMRTDSNTGNYLLFGTPPTSVITDPTTLPVAFGGNVEPAVRAQNEFAVVFGKLAPNAADAPGDFVMEAEGPNITRSEVLIPASRIKHRPPTIIITGGLSDNTAGATNVTLDFDVTYADDDFVVKFPSGFNNQVDLTRTSGGVTVARDLYRESWSISGLTLDAVGLTPLEILGLNEAAGESTATISLGATGQVDNLQPNLGTPSGTLEEDETKTIQFTVPKNTLEDNPIIQINGVDNDPHFEILQFTRTDNDPDWTYLIDVRTIDEAPDNLPTTAFIRFTNPLSTLFDDTDPITVTAAPAPVITSISLDSGSVDTEWPAGLFGTRTVYVTATNVPEGKFGGFTVNPDIPNGGITIDDVSRVGDDFELLMTATGMTVGNSFTLSVSRVTSGSPLTDTSDPITFEASVNPGAGTTYSNFNPGRYVTFELRNDAPNVVAFQSQDYSTSNVTVDLVDGSGNSLTAGALNIESFSQDALIGSILMGDLSGTVAEGTYVRIRVELLSDGVTYTTPDLRPITAPALPVLDGFGMSGTTPGSSFVSAGFTGSFLAPDDEPPGQAPLQFSYTLLPVPGLSGVTVSGNPLPNTLQFLITAIESEAAGQEVRLEINYLGGYPSVVLNTGTFIDTEEGAGAPSVGNITTGEDDSAGSGGVGEERMAFASAGTSTTFTISGTGLGSQNIATDDGSSPVRLLVEGYTNLYTEDNLAESPPGAGLHPDLTDTAFTDVTIVSQSDTQIVMRATLSELYVDTRLRIRFSRPSSHPLGAGYWPDEDIDFITPSDETHPGLTLDGPSTTLLAPNSLPSAGSTRYDFAADFQVALGPNKDGSTFSLTLRLTQALTTPPVVVAVPDPVYGATLTNITVSGTASPFEWQISGRVPTTDEVDDYPLSNWRASFPAAVGLTLRNGIPIASAVLGSPQWLAPGASTGGIIPIGGGGNLGGGGGGISVP